MNSKCGMRGGGKGRGTGHEKCPHNLLN